MRYRVPFLAGLAAGFVLGARAGRERYEQIKKTARRAADNPAVQQAAGAAAAQASTLAKTAKDKVTDQVQSNPRLAGAAEHIPGLRGTGGSGLEQANGHHSVATGPLDGS